MALNRYWQDRPPVHLLVAAYLGIKPKAEAPPMEAQGEALAELFETRPMPKIMTPEEYLAGKQSHGQ